MENNMHLDMFEQSCSINGKQMNGAADQPSVYPPARLGSLNVEENGDYAARTYGYDGFSNIHVDVAGGGVASSDADVLFYDYDGTLLYSYTKEDFLTLTAMPDNPTHEGLVAQGWNWTLTDAQAYVTNYGKHIIGQTYTTSDGRSRLYINLDSTHLSPKLSITPMGDIEVDVDWGDGSEHTTIVATAPYASHTYASAGDYVISFAVNTGTIYLANSILTDSDNSDNGYYACSIYKAEIGTGVKFFAIGFKACEALRTITIPDTVTSLYDSAFEDCFVLSALIFPNKCTTLGSKLCQDCYSLSVVSMSNSITTIGNNGFYNCYALSTVLFPSSIRGIGNYCCSQAYSLSTVVFPGGVEYMTASTFSHCYSLQSMTIAEGVKYINGSAMLDCYSLRTINIPNSVTLINGGVFAGIEFLTINIDNTEDAISGAPWDAGSHSVVNWLRSE